MSLVFALPLGLTALAALLVPLLIHLRRRSEQQRTVFAALHWLPARAKPRTRQRFEEWPLLVVRLLLLALFALLLAQPLLFGAPHTRRWLVVAPGADLSSLPPPKRSEERRWLAAGFPALAQPQPTQPQRVGSLLRELDASLPDDTQLIVIVPEQLDGADATAPVLRHRVRWQVVANAEATNGIASETVTPRPPLAIRHDAKDASGLRYLRAVAAAWRAASPDAKHTAAGDIAPLDASLPSADRALAWIATGPLPAALLDWVNNGGSVLVDAGARVPAMAREGVPLWRDDDGVVLVRGLRQGRGRILQWTRPLTPEATPQLLQPDFPEHVWSLFAPPVPAPTRIDANDYAPRTGAPAWPPQPRDLQPWLLVLIAALFLIERCLASGRREVAAA
ncbi:BatA domain-containing protein [Lysobacter yangpyeongensis]|uniref:BatA domain-containing protein n=1 Tax=Lysobacter yangpyeongensis TaxID=346182 RepID=A0ABW0SK27_9GAMM